MLETRSSYPLTPERCHELADHHEHMAVTDTNNYAHHKRLADYYKRVPIAVKVFKRLADEITIPDGCALHQTDVDGYAVCGTHVIYEGDQ